MSKVKFILLGNKSAPIPWDKYNGNDELSINKTKQDYPGAIIFATFINSKGKEQQEIWANGTQYSVGGNGGGTVYIGTKAVTPKGELSTEGELYEGKYDKANKKDSIAPSVGDIYLLCKVLDGDTFNALTSSGYVWTDAERWEALAGSVNAENVWFNDDITLAGKYSLVGNIIKDENAVDTINVENGMSLKDLITTIFTQEVFPSRPTLNKATLTGTVNNVTITVKNDTKTFQNGDHVAIGASDLQSDTITAKSVTWGGVTNTKIGPLLYGWSDTLNGEKVPDSDNSYITVNRFDVTESDEYHLTYSVSGFSNQPTLETAKGAIASKVFIDTQNLGTIQSGKNTITVKQTNVTGSAHVPEVPSKYIISNIGTLKENQKTEYISSDLLKCIPAEKTTTFTLYGVTPIKTNGTAGTAQQITADAEDYFNSNDFKSDLNLTLELDVTYKPKSDQLQTFYVMFGNSADSAWYIKMDNNVNSITAKGYSTTAKDFSESLTFEKVNGMFIMNKSSGANIVKFLF